MEAGELSGFAACGRFLQALLGAWRWRCPLWLCSFCVPRAGDGCNWLDASRGLGVGVVSCHWHGNWHWYCYWVRTDMSESLMWHMGLSHRENYGWVGEKRGKKAPTLCGHRMQNPELGLSYQDGKRSWIGRCG